jgi:hypothetical protein
VFSVTRHIIVIPIFSDKSKKRTLKTALFPLQGTTKKNLLIPHSRNFVQKVLRLWLAMLAYKEFFLIVPRHRGSFFPALVLRSPVALALCPSLSVLLSNRFKMAHRWLGFVVGGCSVVNYIRAWAWCRWWAWAVSF